MKMLDYEMKKTDDLLYRMIPKPVAKRLRKGEPAVNTCEVRTSAPLSSCRCYEYLDSRPISLVFPVVFLDFHESFCFYY